MGGVRVEKVRGGADVTQHIFSHCERKKRKSRTGGRCRRDEADTRLRRISGGGLESGPHRVGVMGGGWVAKEAHFSGWKGDGEF